MQILDLHSSNMNYRISTLSRVEAENEKRESFDAQLRLSNKELEDIVRKKGLEHSNEIRYRNKILERVIERIQRTNESNERIIELKLSLEQFTEQTRATLHNREYNVYSWAAWGDRHRRVSENYPIFTSAEPRRPETAKPTGTITKRPSTVAGISARPTSRSAGYRYISSSVWLPALK
jgi:hypothetical protein